MSDFLWLLLWSILVADGATAAPRRLQRRSEGGGRGEPFHLSSAQQSLTDAQRRMVAVFDRFGTRLAECVCKVAREVRYKKRDMFGHCDCFFVLSPIYLFPSIIKWSE